MEKNFCDVEKKRRQRGENWSQEEKDLLLELMRESARVIENKQTDTNSNKNKILEWKKVQNKLAELTGKQKDLDQIRGFWRRAKVTAKRNVCQYKKAVKLTGGGQKPPSPSEDDQKMMDLCPTDFVIEENPFDSDANVLDMTTKESSKLENYIVPNNEMTTNKEIITISDTIHDFDDDDVVLPNNSLLGQVITIENAQINDKTNWPDRKQVPGTSTPKSRARKTITSHKGMLVSQSAAFKKKAQELMEEEHSIKMQVHKEELDRKREERKNQNDKHKLEIEILLLEKEKKQLELNSLKKIT